METLSYMDEATWEKELYDFRANFLNFFPLRAKG
jgi:hypothetical protein